MRNPSKIWAFSLILSILFFSACKNFEDFNEVEGIAYDAEFAIPLAHATLTLQDILDGENDISLLEIHPDGKMTLAYEADATNNSASELLGNIPSFPLVLTDTNMTIPVQVFPNLEVTQIDLKNGTLSFELQSGLDEDLEVTITIPQLTNNGVPFSASATLDYQGTLPVTASISAQSLIGYSLNIPDNSMQVLYEATTALGDNVMLNLVTGEANNWNYEMVKGVWAQEAFSIKNDSIELDIYDNWLEGEISFEDPRLLIHVENSIGFPAGVNLKSLTAITTDGQQIELTTNNPGFNIAYPSINEIGEMKETSFVFDKNNSNIKEIFNALPTLLVYEIEGMLNPDDSGEQGFLTNLSTVSTRIEVELPVHGTASGFTIENTSELDLEDMENISNAEFKLVTNNGLPIDVEMQVYFLDEFNTKLDSLFDTPQSILSAAAVNATGEVTNSEETVSIIEIPEERMQIIQSAKNMLLQASFSTYNNGNTPVLIKSDYGVDVRLGAKIGIEE